LKEFNLTIAARISLIAALSLAGTASSSAAFVNFDDVVGSDGYTSPTDVSTRYSALGVTFSDPAGPSGAVLHFSSANVFVANQHQTTDAGDLRLNFSVPVNMITVDIAGFFDSAVLHALAYDSSNSLLGTFDFAQQNVTLPTVAPPVTATIDTGVNNISYLLFAAHPYANPSQFENLYIDNLSFGISAVPEASTWAMLTLGFAGIGFMANRRKNSALATAYHRL
jgi:PEP-CTERM motif